LEGVAARKSHEGDVETVPVVADRQPWLKTLVVPVKMILGLAVLDASIAVTASAYDAAAQ